MATKKKAIPQTNEAEEIKSEDVEIEEIDTSLPDPCDRGEA